MKGVIFNLMEEVVAGQEGLDMWDALLEETGLDGIYSSIGSYPDDQFMKLVAAYADRKGMSPNETLRQFSERAFPHLARKFDYVLARHKHAKDFLLTLNEIIHPEVRKLYPGASVPYFEYSVPDQNSLIIIYRSPKKLCQFGEGLIEGAATYYHTPVTIHQPRCMLREDESCHIHCLFHGKEQPQSDG